MISHDNSKNEMDYLKFSLISNVLYPTMYQPRIDLGNFVHYHVVDIVAGFKNLNEFLNQLIRNTMTSVNQLMTIKKYNLNLLLFVRLLSVNDFNYNLPEEISSQHNSPVLTPCLKTMKKSYTNFGQSFDSDRLMTELPSYSEKSPCLGMEMHPECKSFCNWFYKSYAKLSRKEVFSLMR